MNKKQPHQLQNTKQFVRNFLRINNTREFLVFLFFLFIAFVFWYMMTINGEYEMEFSPKLKLKNVPEDVMVIEPLPERIDIVLKDRGDKLVEYKTRGKLKELVVDYRQYANVKGRTAIYGGALNKLVTSQLASSTAVLSVSLDTLQYYVASAQGVKVPVKVNGTVEASRHYGIGSITLEPDSVTVYASQAYLDSLEMVYTPEVHYAGLTDSISAVLTLDAGVRGVKIVPSEVLLGVSVSPYVTKSVDVLITGYLFPYGTSIKTFPSKAKVVFRVSLEDYAMVSEKDFALQVHYSQIQDNASGKVTPRLETSSDKVYDVKVEPSEVDYLLEVSALSPVSTM